VAALVAATSVACSVVPTPSVLPTPTVSPTAQTTVASPSSAPGSGYSVVQLPSTVRFLAIASLGANSVEGFVLHRYAGWGARVVFDGQHLSQAHSIYLADLSDGSLEVFATASDDGRAWTPDISGDRVVWVELRYADKVDETGEATWRLMVKDIVSGEVRQLQSGVHHRLEGGLAVPPLIKIDGDRVAYAVENTRPGHPLAWRVTLLSLTSGNVERAFDTDLDLFDLDLSGTDICYSEGDAELEVGFKFNTRLMLSTAEHPEPVEIDRDAYDVAISGGRLAWIEDRAAGSQGSPQPIAPVAMTATVSDLVPQQISKMSQALGSPSPGSSLPLMAAYYPAVGDDLVAWRERQSDGTEMGYLYRLIAWDGSRGAAYQLEPTPEVLFASLEGGWLSWYTDTEIGPDGNLVGGRFRGLPLPEIPLPGGS
jgi:hypothetical protein